MAERFVWGYSECQDRNEPRVLRVGFGDGYEQRMPAGLNHQLRRWDVGLRRVLPEVWREIRLFLRARGAVEAFDWQTPDGDNVRVVCDAWTPRHYRERGVYFIDCVLQFREVLP